MVVKMEGTSYLCKTDEVGEICVNSGATASQYWGLQGLTNTTFKVQPLQADGTVLGDAEYTRSGLLGFLGPGGLVFVCGSRDGLMTVTGRKHNADDIIATVLAVEPMRFIYRGRIAVFSIRVLRDERICVIAEQRPECSEEEVKYCGAAKMKNEKEEEGPTVQRQLILAELPVDVQGASGRRFHPPSRHLLPGSRAAELFAQDAVGRDTFVGDEEAVP